MIFDYVKKWLDKNDYPGPLVLMGRSLGSASVLELAMHYAADIDGLIVESGFAYAGPLLALLGIAIAEIGFEEATGFRAVLRQPVMALHELHAGRGVVEPEPETQGQHELHQ
ncbi:MAG: hypothetical protein P8X49_13600 [Syntrophobacterales bacterium]